METKKMTLQEAQEYIKSTKYIVWSEDENKRLQEKLFEIGCGWMDGSQTIIHTKSPFLYVNHDLLILHSEKANCKIFDKSKCQIKYPEDIFSIEIIPSETEQKLKDERKTLIKDLASRLPYGVKIYFRGNTYTLEGIRYTPDSAAAEFNTGFCARIEDVQPYLFPMSSMTEEQKEEYCKLQDKFLLSSQYKVTDSHELCDWLDKNHFDYRDLIPTGSAIDATGLNIY